jgi:hypothetical protein
MSSAHSLRRRISSAGKLLHDEAMMSSPPAPPNMLGGTPPNAFASMPEAANISAPPRAPTAGEVVAAQARMAAEYGWDFRTPRASNNYGRTFLPSPKPSSYGLGPERSPEAVSQEQDLAEAAEAHGFRY